MTKRGKANWQAESASENRHQPQCKKLAPPPTVGGILAKEHPAQQSKGPMGENWLLDN
jgi:hypothetical protein